MAASAALALAFGLQGAAPAPDIGALNWMTGCWTQTSGARVIEETWLAPRGGVMIGAGRTVREGRTPSFEFLRIAPIGGRLAYIAQPSGQAQATFPMKTLTAQEVVFEDLAHDFPQRIIYRRKPDGGIHARVEGQLRGQLAAEEFDYARCPAPK